MPKIKILVSLVGDTGEAWHAGEIHEASVGFARYLVGRGAAVALEDLPAPRLTTQAFQAQESVAQHRDPAKAKGRK